VIPRILCRVRVRTDPMKSFLRGQLDIPSVLDPA